MPNKVKVLIVDDSALVRMVLQELLGSDPEIEVIGAAADPFIAANYLKESVPDVITLDVEMPRMDGITFLQKIMSQHPIPVVMCSSLTQSGCETTVKALEYGAVEIITKPRLGAAGFLAESRARLIETVKAAAKAKVRKLQIFRQRPKLSADAVIPLAGNAKALLKTTEKVVVVGASTGGTEALRVFLEDLPIDCPGVVIVQHMPEQFTASFARRLDTLCQIEVKEAEDNDTVVRGRALVAPGNRHTLLKSSGSRYFVEVRDGPMVNRHRPAVDVLFRSAARYAGKNAVGIIMTGMGDDGAKGMREMKDAGAFNIAESEETCVIFGMPKEAIAHGGVDCIVPLQKIAQELLRNV